jgi:hypothetical protein
MQKEMEHDDSPHLPRLGSQENGPNNDDPHHAIE